MLSSKILFDSKNLSSRFFLSSSNFFLLEKLSKVALQYLFNKFILFNTVSHIKLNFKLKVYPKLWGKFKKPG